MGPDLGTFIANLFLYCYEDKWLLGFKMGDFQNTHLFKSMICFINDLCATNDQTEFGKNYKDI